ALCGAGRGERDGVRTGAPGGPGSGFLPPARARGESRQHRAARSTGVADREDALARNAGGVPRDSVRALGWTTEHSLRSAPGGSFFSRGVAGAEVRRAIQDETGGSLRGGARRFSALTSVALRAPSVSAERKAKPDRSCAIKTGHFNVLPTAGFPSKQIEAQGLKSFYAPQEVQDPPARSSSSPRMIVAASQNGQRLYESMKSDIHTQIFLMLTLVIKLIGLQSGTVMAGGRQSGRHRRCFWCRCISPPADKDRADECALVLP